MLPGSTAASLRPLLPRPSHPSPLVVKLGNSFHPQGLRAVSGRVGKPAKQGGQSGNHPTGCTGRSYSTASPFPSSPVPLLPHRAEAAASQNQPFYYPVGGLGPVEGRGAGGGVMPESPGACGEDTAAAGWWGQASFLEEGKRQPLSTPLTHPHDIK